MLADARELLGDLVVATAEAAYDERWMRLAIATAAAVRAQPSDASAVLEAIDAARVQRLCDDACERSADWQRVCVARSALEALRDLGAPLDPSRGERAVIQRGRDLYRPLDATEDIPRWHWWWRAAGPPNERSLRVNARMRALLPEPLPGVALPASDLVSPRFRDLVARGFVEQAGALVFRDALDKQRVRDLDDEADANRLRLHDVLAPDPSRRPVDIAAAALACARHLAYELQRRELRPSRIVLTVHAGLNTLTFQRITPIDPDVPYARLVLDT